MVNYTIQVHYALKSRLFNIVYIVATVRERSLGYHNLLSDHLIGTATSRPMCNVFSGEETNNG